MPGITFSCPQSLLHDDTLCTHFATDYLDAVYHVVQWTGRVEAARLFV